MAHEEHTTRPRISVPRQLSITFVGAVMLGLGLWVGWVLRAAGWHWGWGMFSAMLILEGIDFLHAGLTGRNGGWPFSLFWLP